MKKAVSFILSIVLVLGLAPTAFAASGKIQGLNQEITTRDFSDLEAYPGRKIEIPLTADMFDWSGNAGEKNEPVTQSQISNAKITIKTTYTKNKSKDIIEDISIGYKTFSESGGKKTAYILVEFIEDYDKTEKIEFDFTVYLNINGKKDSDSIIQFAGTFSRPIIYLEEDETYVDLSDGEMVEPEAYMRSVDAYLGDGVYITTKMNEGKNYYGTASRGIKNEDAKIADAYPEIITAFTLNSNLTDGKVTLDLEDTYYVYNAEGKYVGTSDEELKFSKKYYIADEKIDLSSKSSSSSSGKDEKVDDDDDDDEEVPTAGVPVEEDDDWGYSNDYNNVNDNPSTGAGRYVGAAAMAGLAAVSVIFFCRKR